MLLKFLKAINLLSPPWERIKVRGNSAPSPFPLPSRERD